MTKKLTCACGSILCWGRFTKCSKLSSVVWSDVAIISPVCSDGVSSISVVVEGSLVVENLIGVEGSLVDTGSLVDEGSRINEGSCNNEGSLVDEYCKIQAL